MTRPAVLFDKDGTLVENIPWNVDPRRIRLVDGAQDAIRRLAAAGFAIAIVSNQPGVALGRFEERDLVGVRERMEKLLADCGARLHGFFYCPHHPDGVVAPYVQRCDCRKPAPGLLLRALSSIGTRRASAWMVGDILDDVEAGSRAGCRTLLLDSGGETEWLDSPLRRPEFVAHTFSEVADIILRESRAAA